MDIIGAIISGFLTILAFIVFVYALFALPGLVLVIGGIGLALGILVWPLIQKIL